MRRFFIGANVSDRTLHPAHLPDAIRRAGPADWHQILQISLDAFGASSWPWERWRSVLAAPAPEHPAAPQNLALVAEVPAPAAAPPLAGYIVLQMIPGDLEIQALAVARAARRLGWGTRLLQAACERGIAAGCDMAYLEVRASNQAAQDFYRRRGFLPYGRRRGYYHSPVEDALLMRKPLVPG